MKLTKMHLIILLSVVLIFSVLCYTSKTFEGFEDPFSAIYDDLTGNNNSSTTSTPATPATPAATPTSSTPPASSASTSNSFNPIDDIENIFDPTDSSPTDSSPTDSSPTLTPSNTYTPTSISTPSAPAATPSTAPAAVSPEQNQIYENICNTNCATLAKEHGISSSDYQSFCASSCQDEINICVANYTMGSDNFTNCVHDVVEKNLKADIASDPALAQMPIPVAATPSSGQQYPISPSIIENEENTCTQACINAASKHGTNSLEYSYCRTNCDDIIVDCSNQQIGSCNWWKCTNFTAPNNQCASSQFPGSSIFSGGSQQIANNTYGSGYNYGTAPAYSPSNIILGPGGEQILATTQNTINGIPVSQIPAGQQDLYILKSEIVPPVCPACPNVIVDKSLVQKECTPCPPCARCPEPSFDCKKVPNYSLGASNTYLPRPMLNSFSQFGA